MIADSLPRHALIAALLAAACPLLAHGDEITQSELTAVVATHSTASSAAPAPLGRPVGLLEVGVTYTIATEPQVGVGYSAGLSTRSSLAPTAAGVSTFGSFLSISISAISDSATSAGVQSFSVLDEQPSEKAASSKSVTQRNSSPSKSLATNSLPSGILLDESR